MLQNGPNQLYQPRKSAVNKRFGHSKPSIRFGFRQRGPLLFGIAAAFVASRRRGRASVRLANG
jgi:hypothetical protein